MKSLHFLFHPCGGWYHMGNHVWKSSSAGEIFPQKIASLCFQTLQQKGRKIQVVRCVLKNGLQIIATVALEKPTYF